MWWLKIVAQMSVYLQSAHIEAQACLPVVQVVLPLLQNEVVATGWISEQDFLTGFALVQAMPGPLFNFAAYLGNALTMCRTWTL